MLVYLATYPRCGAALLRDTIALNWDLATANLYEPVVWSDELAVVPTACPALLAYNAGPVRRRMIKSPVGALLTADVRERLAASPELFLLKTHERPPVETFKGEIAIQMVRHPGAAIVSYWRLQQTLKGVEMPFARFNGGDETGGLWGEYHAAWSDTDMPLNRMRYEDYLDQPDAIVWWLANALGLPVPRKPQTIAMGDAHARNPIRNPGAGEHGWKAALTDAKIARLWELHGDVAAGFGYGIDGRADHASFHRGTYLIRPTTSTLAVA